MVFVLQFQKPSTAGLIAEVLINLHRQRLGHGETHSKRQTKHRRVHSARRHTAHGKAHIAPSARLTTAKCKPTI